MKFAKKLVSEKWIHCTPGGVLNTKVVIRTCRKHGSQNQAIRYVNGSLFIAKFGIFMGVIFKFFPNLRQNGANLSISSKILQIFARKRRKFLKKFVIFDPKFLQFGMWMGQFFLKIGIFMGATSNFPAARPYPN